MQEMGLENMLGLSSSYFAFRGKGIYDSVESVFGLGFETAELGAAHRFEPRVWDTVKRIKRDFPDKAFTVHGLFPPLREKTWFNPSNGLTKQNKGIVDGLFKAAQIVEAKLVGIHPGFLNEVGFSFDKKRGFDTIAAGKPLPVEESWNNFFELMAYASSLSQDAGIKLAIENIHDVEVKPLVFSAKDFEKVFARFPELGMLFDFGHALFSGQAAQFVKVFSPKIAEIHMHWSRRQSQSQQKDEHAALTSAEQLQLFKAVPQLKKIPIIFEHGTDVGPAQILKEKWLVSHFLDSI